MSAAPLPSCRAELDALVKLAEVSSYAEGKRAWTVLGVWWRSDTSQPFVAVVEGRIAGHQENHLNRFRATGHGTLLAALREFDQSQLRDELVSKVPADVTEHYPDADVIRMQAAAKRRAERSYQGPLTIKGVVSWLYGAEYSHNAYAMMVEEDFGIKARTVRAALDEDKASGWANAFIAAMRHFDRQAWDRQRSGLGKVEAA